MAVDDPEGRVTQGCVVGSIVGVLSPRKPRRPLSGTIAGEATQLHGDDLVRHLRLAIGLRVERQAHLKLGTHGAEQGLPER